VLTLFFLVAFKDPPPVAKNGKNHGNFSKYSQNHHVSLDFLSGLGAIVYGLMQDSEVSDSIKNRDIKSAEDAQKSRNASYGIGAGLLASGLGVVIFF
jgi:hypothetical protein